MTEIDCCYNCKHFGKTFYLGDVWVCLVRKGNPKIFNDFEKVKPNNICEKWENREQNDTQDTDRT